MSQSSTRGTPSSSSEAGGIRSTTAVASSKDTKVAKPDLYHGDRQKLDDWLNQVEMYFMFTPLESNKKTLFATTYLRGRAQHWMKPMLQKYLDGKGDTDGILQSFNKFKEEIRRIFGISNEAMTAVRVIQHLRQHASASEYAAKFQEHAQVTDWDDSALMTMFRRGLKENVKDELMRDGRSIEDLDDLIRATIDIDDKLYERAMERRHDINPRGRSGFIPYNGNKKFNNNRNRTNNNYYGPMPMELDVTEPSRQSKGKFNRSLTKMTCYACGKQGHIARDCRSKNKVQRRQFNMMQQKPQDQTPKPEEPATTRDNKSEVDNHASLSWTACYNDSCLTHYSDKMGSGWFPQKPKKRAKGQQREFNIIARPEDLEDGEIHEEIESDPASETDSETMDEDSTDNEESPDHIDGETSFRLPSNFNRIFKIMVKHSEEVFPIVEGQRFLHPQNFDQMLHEIRNAFWDHRLFVVDYDFQDFIQERPPLGSIFAPQGYIIPTGERVNRSMREGINLLRSRYAQAQKQQQVLYERHSQETNSGKE